MTVIDSVSGKELDLCSIIMRLDSLTVIFCLHIIGMRLVLEEMDVLFACKHWTDGVEEAYLII